MFVGEWRERNGGEASALQPMHRGGVDGHSLLSCDVRPILEGDIGPFKTRKTHQRLPHVYKDMCLYLEVVVLSLLLRLQVQTGQPAQVLLAHRLVHCGAAPDSLTVVVGCVGPPIRFGLHVAQDHVFDGGGQAWHLE